MTEDQRFLKAMSIDPKDIDFPPAPRPIPQESVLHVEGVEAVDGMALMPMSTFNALLQFASSLDQYASSMEGKAWTSQIAVEAAKNWCKEAQEAAAAMRRWRAAFLGLLGALVAQAAWMIAHR